MKMERFKLGHDNCGR